MTESQTTDLLRNYDRVKAEIAAAESKPGAVTLVAVSKTVPASRIEPVLAAGQRCFGENRVQESMEKWPGLKARYPGVELHLIGPLQTNKVREAVALFDVIQTLDRPRLAEALVKERDRSGRCPSLLIEVNCGAEPQKAGVLPADAPGFIAACRDQWRLPVIGLMCIPPADQDPAPHFALLAALAHDAGLPVVSMGMSGDFALAARMGATHVRVGSAIFGARG